VAKLIVTGRDRTQALERSRRALAEFVVDGMPTVIPFHQTVVDDPAFIGDGETFGVYTSWIETEFDNQIPPYAGESESLEATERQAVTVEVGGRRLEVVLPAGFAAGATAAGPQRKPKREKKKAGAAASGDAVTSPMQGTIVKVAVEEGQQVAEGDVIVVLEAMKMEQPLKAHKGGTVTGLSASVGDSVTSGAVVCELKD
jgi:acetyl-CoA/propionyl-CoA carboxylase biotin carboxyl carrier protein